MAIGIVFVVFALAPCIHLGKGSSLHTDVMFLSAEMFPFPRVSKTQSDPLCAS